MLWSYIATRGQSWHVYWKWALQGDLETGARWGDNIRNAAPSTPSLLSMASEAHSILVRICPASSAAAPLPSHVIPWTHHVSYLLVFAQGFSLCL